MKRLLRTAMIGLSIIAVTVAVTAKDSKTKEATVKPYPLSICLVTDSDLGSMGAPITKVYEGQQYKFCCKPCVKEFEKNPAMYQKKLSELSQKQSDSTNVSKDSVHVDK